MTNSEHQSHQTILAPFEHFFSQVSDAQILTDPLGAHEMLSVIWRKEQDILKTMEKGLNEGISEETTFKSLVNYDPLIAEHRAYFQDLIPKSRQDQITVLYKELGELAKRKKKQPSPESEALYQMKWNALRQAQKDDAERIARCFEHRFPLHENELRQALAKANELIGNEDRFE